MLNEEETNETLKRLKDHPAILESLKGGIATKQCLAACSSEYREKVLKKCFNCMCPARNFC